MQKWMMYNKKLDSKEIGMKYNVDQVIAKIMINRDVKDYFKYLNGNIDNLYNPHTMKDIDKSVDILKNKINQNKRIRIISDYDVDGVISNYILFIGLSKCGAKVDYQIPDRIIDGYGINENIIEKANNDGIDTIITCDNGIAAINQVNYAKDLGMTVIVTDHHDIPFEEQNGEKIYLFSNADAVINPKQFECKYPFKLLCGAGVAFKLIQALYEKFNIEQEEALKLIEYVAIATVCDIVDLVDENRIIVKEGLKLLNETQNIGLKALLKVNELEDKIITQYHLGFIIGPCINATGRLETAKKSVELLLETDEQKALSSAMDLKVLNEERKIMTENGTKLAIEMIENSDLNSDNILVVYLKDCHESVAGIIAGRIREIYNKPTFIFTDTSNNLLKASGRSIETYNMYEGMNECKDLFVKFGGHPMAGGLSLERGNLEKFREKLNKNSKLTKEDLYEKILIDVPLSIGYITEDLIEQLEVLEPFGKGNEKPVFAQKDLKIINAKLVGNSKNVIKFLFEDNRGFRIDGILFREAEEFNNYYINKFGKEEVEKMYNNEPNNILATITYYPTINEFRGNKILQIVVQKYK